MRLGTKSTNELRDQSVRRVDGTKGNILPRKSAHCLDLVSRLFEEQMWFGVRCGLTRDAESKRRQRRAGAQQRFGPFTSQPLEQRPQDRSTQPAKKGIAKVPGHPVFGFGGFALPRRDHPHQRFIEFPGGFGHFVGGGASNAMELVTVQTALKHVWVLGARFALHVLQSTKLREHRMPWKPMGAARKTQQHLPIPALRSAHFAITIAHPVRFVSGEARSRWPISGTARFQRSKNGQDNPEAL